jgi:hypothetical protein
MNHIRAFAVILILLSFPLSLAIAQGLPQRVTALEAEVAALEATVATHESQIAALSQPSSATVIFALDRPIPFTTDPVDTSGGWTKMTVSVGTTGSLCGYSLLIPSQGMWIEQIRVNCDCGRVCPVVSIPVISDFYEFSTGTASGTVTAAGVLER